MPNSTFIVPREIFSAPGALESLTTISSRCFLILSGPDVGACGTVEDVRKLLRGRKSESAGFDSLVPEALVNPRQPALARTAPEARKAAITSGRSMSLGHSCARPARYETPDRVACFN
jgi:hypothetical protein